MADAICSIDDCEDKVCARGWCHKHYRRWLKHGDPLHVTPWSPPPQNRARTIGCKIEGCDRKHQGKGYCDRHYAQNWYAENQDRAKATQAIRRSTRRETANATSAAWRQANPERALEATRRWYAENKDRVREYKRKYRTANRDKIRAANNARKALHRGVEVNDLTAQQWTEIRALFKQRCAYCNCKPRVLTMDHVVPLIKGGHHTAANIVPACQTCNSRKNDGDAPTHQPLLM